MKEQKIRILALGGSLRAGSLSRALIETSVLLEAADALCPDIAEIKTFDRLGEIPLFNEELEDPMPEAVAELKREIEAADAVLFVTPEYDYSVPGYLKNAIDWASRPYGANSFDDKPGAIMSSSTGMLGGARAQYALRKVCVYLNVHLLNTPEVFVPNVMDKVREGRIVDEHTRKKIRELLDALCDWSKRLRK